MSSKKSFFIPASHGQLEATIDTAEIDVAHVDSTKNSTQTRKIVAVCCHPHPVHGGAMTNKVIHTVARALAGLGVEAVRFNFRGVGKSTGSYDEGRGEQQDLRDVVAWARAEYPDHELWLAGFSFGSWIAALNAKSLEATRLISIAPPVNRFSFDEFEQPDCLWLVVQGDADEIVDPQAVFSWLESLDKPPTTVVMQGAGHFFHSRLVELREHLEHQLG